MNAMYSVFGGKKVAGRKSDKTHLDHVVDGDVHVVAADLPGQLVGPPLGVLGAVLAAHVARDEDAVAELLGVPGGVAGVPDDLPDVGQDLLLARGHGLDDLRWFF